MTNCLFDSYRDRAQVVVALIVYGIVQALVDCVLVNFDSGRNVPRLTQFVAKFLEYGIYYKYTMY